MHRCPFTRKLFKTRNYCEARKMWAKNGGFMVKTGQYYIISACFPRTPQPQAIFYALRGGYTKSRAARDLEDLRLKKWLPLLSPAPACKR